MFRDLLVVIVGILGLVSLFTVRRALFHKISNRDMDAFCAFIKYSPCVMASDDGRLIEVTVDVVTGC